MLDDAPAQDDANDPISKDPLFTKLRKWVKEDLEETVKAWRDQAREDHKFFHSDQWSAEDKAFLEKQKRPVVTFNQVGPIVRAIAGTAINARQEVTYKGRGAEDIGLADVWNEGARWFRDQKDAEHEEVDAFEDDIIAGLGFTETRMDYDNDPEGEPYVEHMDWQEMGWDCSAKKRNLADARRMWRQRAMRRYEAKNLFPDEKPGDLDAKWAGGPGEGVAIVDREKARRYEDQDGEDSEALGAKDDDIITVVHIQWWEYETFFRVKDPMTGRDEDLKPEQIKKLLPVMPGIAMSAQKYKRKVWKQAFLGKKVLETSDNPVEGFTWQCMTCFFDPVKHNWYGMVALMRDPQRYANKWRSQVLHQMNKGAKGGVMAERGAVLDSQKFLDSWARTEEVTIVADGALTENKIREKPYQPFPAGFYQLVEHATEAMRATTGVSLEMMGTREAQQAASLEHQRRTQSMVMLAGLFAAYKNYRKRQGKIMLQVMQRFLEPERLALILGQNFPPEAVQAAYTAQLQYDIVVDEAPSSPNLREMVWSMLQPMWSSFPPPVQAALFGYFPGPERIGQEIQAAYQKLEPQPPPPEQMEQEAARTDKMRSEAEENRAQAAEAMAETALKQREVMMPPMMMPRPNGRFSG